MPSLRVVAGTGVLPERGGGPERVVVQLVRAMLDQDTDLELVLRAVTWRQVARARSVLAAIDSRAELSITRLPGSATARLQDRFRLPPERLLAGPFDVFHQLSLDHDPAVPSRQLVVTVHDTVALEWPGAEGVLSKRARRLVQRSSRVVTPSAYARGAAIEQLGADPARVVVVPHGVDHAVFHPAAAPTSSRTLLYVGGSTPRKNVVRIISAVHRARNDAPTADVRLVLAGPVGRAEEGLRADAPAGLDPSALEFVGHVDDPTLARLYRSSTALLYPSLYEGFGLPVLEAMASGTQVITSRRTALADVAGDAAIYVDPEDVAAIADGIRTAVDAGSEEREARVQLGIDHAAAFTWTRSAAALLAVYREVLEQ